MPVLVKSKRSASSNLWSWLLLFLLAGQASCNIFQPLNLPNGAYDPNQFFSYRIVVGLRAPFVGYGRIPFETVIVSNRCAHEDRLVVLHDCLPIHVTPRFQGYKDVFGILDARWESVLVFCAYFLFAKNT